MNTAPKKKAPTPAKAIGANSEQLSFLPPIALSPQMPAMHTKAWLALLDLTRGKLTQIDWLETGRGWRLAAAIKELAYLGWPLVREWVRPNGRATRIKCYELAPAGLEIARERMKGVV